MTRTIAQHAFKHPDDATLAVIHSTHPCQCGDPENEVPASACCQPYRDAVPTTDAEKRAWIAANPSARTITL